MPEKTLAEMSSEEFESLLDKMQTEEFGEFTTDEFFTALSAMAGVETPRETIELTATINNGRLTFLEPAPLRVHDNEILVGDKRVVIKLIPEKANSA